VSKKELYSRLAVGQAIVFCGLQKFEHGAQTTNNDGLHRYMLKSLRAATISSCGWGTQHHHHIVCGESRTVPRRASELVQLITSRTLH
jgi:hypothetical protein